MLTTLRQLKIGDRRSACFHDDTQGLIHVKILSKIERLLLVLGILFVVVFVGAQAYRTILSRVAIKQFKDLQREHSVETNAMLHSNAVLGVDFSLWSPDRVTAYERSLQQYFVPPLAVLRIAKVHLEVPVLEGTDDLALNRGVGHIAGTVRPGENGNIGIAGHRDGFFRALKDVGPGDVIELLTPEHTDTYVVDQILLVNPKDVSVLRPRPVSTITLVTCFPFYYVGSAPERYIVQASAVNLSNLASVDKQIPKPKTQN